jgi:hypothetical protein
MKKLLPNIAHRFGYTVVPNWQVDRLDGDRHLARLGSLSIISLKEVCHERHLSQQ